MITRMVFLISVFFMCLRSAMAASTDVQPLVKYVRAQGFKSRTPQLVCEHLGLPCGAPEWSVEVSSSNTVDHFSRVLAVFFESTTTFKPAVIDLGARRHPRTKSFHFVVKPDGTILKAEMIACEYNESGQLVPNSCVVSLTDPESPELKEQFQKELSFWHKAAATGSKKVKSAKPKKP
jgi:hypothetical protein